MPRPRIDRLIRYEPGSDYFKPRGIRLCDLEEIVLTLDELETVRLGDLEGFYQERAAEKMKISRPTFSRLIDSAHKKIAQALVLGKALKIEGGTFKMTGKKRFKCSDCEHEWEVAYRSGRPSGCPSCKSTNLHRAEDDRGYTRREGGSGPGRAGGRGRGRGRCKRTARD